VKFQFLGFGYIEFGIENPLSTEFTAVHRVLYANNNIIPNLDNPSLPFTISSKNTTCTSPVTVITSSVAGYTQGIIEDLGLISSFSHNKEISSSLTSIFTLRSQFVFNNKFNLMCVKLKEIIISNYGNQFVELFLYDNTDLENADFQNSDNDDCVVQYDTSATVSNGNKIYTIGVCAGQTVTKNLNDLRIFANHIKHITVCAKTLTSTTNVHVCLVHEQD
jgi:hypothetical protein